MLSLREVTRGQRSWSMRYNNSKNNTSGNIFLSDIHKACVMTQAACLGTKQIRSLPGGAPTLMEEEESTSLGMRVHIYTC